MEMITDREIIVDINKIKDMKRNININSDKIINKYRNELERISKIIDYEGIIGGTILILGPLFNQVWLVFLCYWLTKMYINNKKRYKEKLNKSIEEEINSRELYLKIINQYINDQEAVLDFRKGKKLTESKIKNIIFSCSIDKQYSYDLKRIKSEYQLGSSSLMFPKDTTIPIEAFCSKMNELYPGEEEIKTKSKVLMYNKH